MGSRQSLKMLVVLCVFGSFASVGGLAAGAPQVPVGEENQCIVCHTNVKKLIRLGWKWRKPSRKKASPQ